MPDGRSFGKETLFLPVVVVGNESNPIKDKGWELCILVHLAAQLHVNCVVLGPRLAQSVVAW